MRKAAFVLAWLFLAVCCQGRIITVDDDGLADFDNIQAAIDDANDGDEIIVTDGVYSGEGNRDIDFLGKAITVKSESGPQNCIIDCNGTRKEPHRGFCFHGGEDRTSVVSGFTIRNGAVDGCVRERGGGGILCYQSSPTITNCIITENRTYCWAVSLKSYGGGLYIDRASPTISNCTVKANAATHAGGGILCRESNPIIINSKITGNKVTYSGPKGGGIYCSESELTLQNCTIAGNASRDRGGAIWCNSSNLTITNCTFTGNWAPRGKALACDSWGYPCDILISNCILVSDANQVWNNDGSTIAITYSDVQGGWAGEGNIDSDPCFVEAGYWDVNGTPDYIWDDFWVDGNYHLLSASPCIDAGDPNYVAGRNERDLDGNPRVLDGDEDGLAVVDMGAYEYGLVVEAEVEIKPETVNLASRGKWIRCYIRLGEEYDVAEIEAESVLLEYEVQAESVRIDEQRQVAVARFRRAEVRGFLEAGEVEVTISGELTDGTVFEGADVIRVIDKGGKKKVGMGVEVRRGR